MRLPIVRFRIRVLLVGVAVVALILGTFVALRRRASDFRQRANAHVVVSKWLAHQAWLEVKWPPMPGGLENQERRRSWYIEASQYHDDLARKYASAADRPWLPIMADPPVPSGNPGIEPGGEFKLFPEIEASVLKSMPVFGTQEEAIP